MKASTLAAILIASALLVGSIVSDTVGTLAFGWVGYLARVLPRLAPDGPTVLVSLAAAGLFLLGVHWLGRKTGRWRWRFSAAVTLMMFVLFAASVAMVGIAHMSLWYATDPAPIRDLPVLAKLDARVKTANNLQQFGMALHNHHDIYGSFPAAAQLDPDGRMLHGWETQMLLTGWMYNTIQIDMKRPWDDPQNVRYFQCVLPELINPSLADAPFEDEHDFGLNHYSANGHVFRAKKSLTFAEIKDGLSNTIALGEVNNHFQPWGRPMNVRDPARGINRSPRGFGGPRGRSGALMLMADGSVRFVSEKVSPAVLRALATPAGGEEVDERDLDK